MQKKRNTITIKRLSKILILKRTKMYEKKNLELEKRLEVERRRERERERQSERKRDRKRERGIDINSQTKRGKYVQELR